MGPATLRWIVDEVVRRRPGLILEFGSGASTVALAWAVRQVTASATDPRIVSFEQDVAQAERTRDLLRAASLGGEAEIVVAPLARQTIEGVATTCYTIPEAGRLAIAGRRADMVVIDGPAAEDGARFGTLPLVREFLAHGATCYLDDALRDGELWTAGRWGQLGYLDVDGIALVEKGVLVVRVR
jgi:predicted O-methyltransferase YrrM